MNNAAKIKKPCKCGSSSHNRISHTECPLNNKKKAETGEEGGSSVQLDGQSPAKKSKHKVITDESTDSAAAPKPENEPFHKDSDDDNNDDDDDDGEEELSEEDKEEEQRLATDYEHRLVLTFPDHIKTLSAENKVCGTKTGFTVWTIIDNCGYGGKRSAARSRHPGQFDSVFSSMHDANLRAKYAFYVLNPWGEDFDGLNKGEEAEASIEGGLLTIAMVSAGMDLWKAGVMLSREYEIKKNDAEQRR